MLAPRTSIVPAISVVSVARMFALTPLPSPSDRTTINSAGVVVILTQSPQSSSPCLHRLSQAISTNSLMASLAILRRLFHEARQLGQQHLGLRRRLAQQPGDLVGDPHLLVDHFLGAPQRF